jgi:hypothetical protein
MIHHQLQVHQNHSLPVPVTIQTTRLSMRADDFSERRRANRAPIVEQSPESQFTAENFFYRGRAHAKVAKHNFCRSKRISCEEPARDVANDDYWSAWSLSILARSVFLSEMTEPLLDSRKRQSGACECAQQLGMVSFPTKSLEPEEFDDKSMLSLIH